jgi:hypothetical protein
MKITPMLQGGNSIAGSENTGSMPQDKIARAKAIASGMTISPSDTPTDPSLNRAQETRRRIKMTTQVSPDRAITSPAAEAILASETTSSESPTVDEQPVIEDTKPLSPQFAALAKQRRALQAKERELVDREKALTSQPTSNQGVEELTARLKSQPLSVLQEYGVTYDQLTEAILGNQGNPEVAQLKAEIKALKEGVDKTFSDRDSQQEQAVLGEIQRDIDRRTATDDNYELIRATNSQEDVKDLIHRTFKETGEILDVSDALKLVEDELVTESLKIAGLNKVRSRLTATPQQQTPSPKQFRTLTNRDSAAPTMDRRSRAIAAALGQLKR